MKPSRHSSITLYVISIGLVAFFIYFVYLNKDEYINLLHISALAVLALLLISITYPIINGAIIFYMLQSLGARPSIWECYIIAAASSFANLLPFTGGLIFKGIYLKNRYRISYTKFFGAMLASFVCFVATNGIIGLSILLYWLIIEKKAISPVLLAAFFAMTASLITFWLPFDIINPPSSIRKRLDQILEGWMFIRKTHSIVLKIVGLQTCLMLLLATRYWIAFRMISQNVSLSQCILFAAVSILELIISITPGGLGIREVVVAAIAAALQVDVRISIVAVELDRLVSTFVIILLGWVSATSLKRQLSKSLKGLDEKSSIDSIAAGDPDISP